MYKFHLESVLKYRGNIEKSKMQEMLALRLSLLKEKRMLSENVRRVKEVLDHLAKEEKSGIISDEVSMYRYFLKSARTRIFEKENTITNIHHLMEKKRVELMKVSIDKKIMERLKKKKRRDFLLNLKKKDQKIMDEIASNRAYER